MDLLSRFASLIYNHRRKFIIGGLLFGGSYAAYHFAFNKLQEMQEREIQDMLEGVRKQRYFTNVLETCDQTIFSLDKTLRKSINELTNLKKLIETLKKRPEHKVKLWEELKIVSFTHLTLLIYTESLLVTILRIQLGIIGGFMYKEKFAEENRIKSSVQEKYLSLFVDFTKNGLNNLYELIKKKVSSVLHDIPLTKTLTVQNLKEIFWSIQTSILNDENELISNLKSSLRINILVEECSDPLLKELYLDTLDMLCNTEIVREMYSNVSHGFIHFSDRVVRLISKNGTTAVDTSLPFARYIPLIYNLLNDSDHQDNQCPWFLLLISSDKFKLLCANVYEAYC